MFFFGNKKALLSDLALEFKTKNPWAFMTLCIFFCVDAV